MSGPNINAPKFFVDHKKGEVVELMNLLKNPTIDKDPKKKKDIIKRVIAYMTLGVDVSKLFHEMVKASYINDIVTKKMVFLYIVNYADESDSAILAINTFLKDIKNENPKIRGLALRSLCSLKFKGAYEYFANALYESLKDPHQYVRKTAVMALLKVYHLNPSLITDKDIETLYEMIKDKDPVVVTNTLNVLNEILSKEGGIAISGKMVNYLLNIIQDFNEWGQNMILSLVAKYRPKDESQMFDILNTLEDKYFLKHSCAAIVLATAKVFINFTKEKKIYDHVLKRVRDPLITLMTSSEVAGNYEMSYVILSHMFIIIQKGGRSLFSEYYKKFYVHFDEPFYIKKLKLEIMVEIANESNFSDILNEMEEYVYDVNAKFAMHTLRSIGNVAINVDQSVLSVVNILKAFLGRNVDYIVSETMIVLKSKPINLDLLRKHPDVIQEFLPLLEPAISVIGNNPKGLSSLIWILGEFGEYMEISPYVLENLIENNSENSTEVVYSMLLAACKLFFKSPGEMQGILGRLFEFIFRNFNDVDLKERAGHFYSLMQNNIEEAEYVICNEKATVEAFYSELDAENSDKVFDEFNTLSVLYQKPAEKFLRQFLDVEQIEKKEEEPEEALIEEAKEQKEEARIEVPPYGKETLSAKAILNDEEYQRLWEEFQQELSEERGPIPEEIDYEEFVKYLESELLFVKAYNEGSNALKMYLYSKDAVNDIFILIDFSLDFSSSRLKYTIRSEFREVVESFNGYFLQVVDPLLNS